MQSKRIVAFAAGLVLGFFTIFLWGLFTPSSVLSWPWPPLVNGSSWPSLLAPTGAEIVVFGFRIKHWMVGLGLIVCSAALVSFKKISAFLFGVGIALILDEIL